MDHSKLQDGLLDWYQLTCLRKDALPKLTTYLARNFKTIVTEELNVSGMLANHKLARAIQRCGFYEFRHQLDYKCKLYGSNLFVNGRFEPTSKLMRCCKVKLENLTLAMRTIACPCCGKEIDRDLNAALNARRCRESLGIDALVDWVKPTSPE